MEFAIVLLMNTTVCDGLFPLGQDVLDSFIEDLGAAAIQSREHVASNAMLLCQCLVRNEILKPTQSSRDASLTFKVM